MDNKEFQEGRSAYVSGYSVYYNPYSSRGTSEQFYSWVAGWQLEESKDFVNKWSHKEAS